MKLNLENRKNHGEFEGKGDLSGFLCAVSSLSNRQKEMERKRVTDHDEDD